MKKLFFIASVGLLFSCNNGGTCVCTQTAQGQTYITEQYFEKDAQENCDAFSTNCDLSSGSFVDCSCEVE